MANFLGKSRFAVFMPKSKL